MFCVPAEHETGLVVGTSPDGPDLRTAVAVQAARQFRLHVLTRQFSSTRQSVDICQMGVGTNLQAIAANIIGTSARSQIEFSFSTGILSVVTGCTHVVQLKAIARL